MLKNLTTRSSDEFSELNVTRTRLPGLAIAAAAFCGAAMAQPPPAADLCNFPVEQLTLASTRTDLSTWALARGWKDVSTGPHTSRGRQTVEKWRFEAPADSPPHQAQSARKSVMLEITNGKATTLAVTDDAPPHVRDRAKSICAMLDDRFSISGCDARSLSTTTLQITARPKGRVGDGYCQVVFSTGRIGPATFQMSVSWYQGAPTPRHSPPGQ